MTTETAAAPDVDVRSLRAEDFTASDRARINLGCHLTTLIGHAEDVLGTLCSDEAVSGDYVAQASTLQALALFGVVADAVIVERVRGTEWDRIGKPFSLSAEEAEAKWGAKVEEWRSQTKVQSDLVRDPARHLDRVDRHIAADGTRPARSRRQPLSRVLDAAAALTGRDVAAADRAFAGTQACSHCDHCRR
ncbi:hypothetical protein ACIQWA_36815 [Kitasatospora sp. NPDC098652]|uniref:hypothetical protein n=1 Tax=Kitasatospora sp. NPDC098652 TaxID=3364095 RepID=UPI00382C2115